MKLSSKILLICAFSCGLLAYNGRFWLWEEAFFHLIALEFLLLYVVIWSELKGTWKLVCQVFALTCLSSLADELFFDPTAFEINEYIGFLLIILITIIFYGRSKSRAKREKRNKFFGPKRLGD